MTPEDIRRGVECLLFVSGGPLGAREMSLALEVNEQEVEIAAQELVERDLGRSGLKVEKVGGGWRMVTRPEYARAVARFVGKRAQKLSRAALETLAILAYNQPCTQPEIEAIRGVDSSGVLKSLIERGLVKEVGRKDAPGRPIMYSTTDEFLVYFGLNNLGELPDPGTHGAATLPLDLDSINPVTQATLGFQDCEESAPTATPVTEDQPDGEDPSYSVSLSK